MTKVITKEDFKSLPRLPLTPYQQKDGYRKDGTPRLGKWKVLTQHGVMPATVYYWWYHTGRVPNKIPIFLDRSAPLDTSKKNLALLTKQELKNLVHHNNKMYSNNPRLQRLAILVAKSSIAVREERRKLNEKRNSSNC